MNSLVPSEVVARFRATSRKLFRPKLTFSARIVSNCTSPFFRPFSSYSMRSLIRFRWTPPPRGTEGRATHLVDINLLGRPRCETSQLRSSTAPLNSAGARVRSDAVRSLRRHFRGPFLSSLRRARDRCARGSDGFALPPLRHPLPWKFLSTLRPSDGRVGIPAPSASGRRTVRALRLVDPRDGRLPHLRDYGFRGSRGRPDSRRPGDPVHPVRTDGEQRFRLRCG